MVDPGPDKTYIVTFQVFEVAGNPFLVRSPEFGYVNCSKQEEKDAR